MRVIKPSMHFLENFMPLFTNEKYALEQLKKAAEIPFYEALELGVLKDKTVRQEVRKIVEQRNWQLSVWCSPVIQEQGYSLSSLDEKNRKAAVASAIELIASSAECGATRCGLQSGPDVSADLRDDAKKALTESCLEISKAAEQFKDMYLIIEPLDRHVHKKALLGPIDETVEWFENLKKDCSNFYIHWDSAHEKLGGADLLKSIELAGPHLAQFHICNCITDANHPYYGDHHMDVGSAPDFETWGYLTPEVGASIVKKAQSLPDCEGVKFTTCALEVRSHLADDVWAKEKLIRTFLQRTFDLAGISYNK